MAHVETRAVDVVVDGRTVVTARPVAAGPWPGVVMLHEGWGIDDVLRRHADRLASAGYLVNAPDLLGEGAWLRCIRVTFKAFQARAGKPFEMIESCRKQLRAHRDCTGKVGVIGFCMGGGFALLLSAQGYHAASVNYGPVPPDIGRTGSALVPHRCQLRRQGLDDQGRVGAARSAACSRHTARCRGLSSGRPQLLERQAKRPTAVSPDNEADPCGTGADLGRRCVEANRGLLRRAPQLVMSLRRKCQTANQSAMIAYPMDHSAPVIMSE